MKYRVVLGYSLGGGVDLLPGAIVEMRESDAVGALYDGRLKPATEEEVAAAEKPKASRVAAQKEAPHAG